MEQDTANDCAKAQSLLRELESNIAHAREIEQHIEPIVRTLRETNINISSYKLSTSLDINKLALIEIFALSEDVQFRDFIISPLTKRATLVYVREMVDQSIINKHVIEKLVAVGPNAPALVATSDILHYIKNTLLTAASLHETSDTEAITQRILTGDTALFIDTLAISLIISTRDVKIRAISEPKTENDVRGPREGFTEDLRTNITLIRRRIKSPNLMIKTHNIGTRSNTNLALLYYKGIVNYNIVCEVERRLKDIKIDAPETLGVQRFLEDHPYSPFPTIMATERPDRSVSALIKGKVVVMMDGTPFALVIPTFFSDFFITGDDYYEKPIPATTLRFLRYIAGFFALTVPALYIAITGFHPGLLPAPLTLAIGTAREAMPFPVFLEAVIMIFFLEIMQEAGIRLPKTIGQAVSIVGGLVIGDAAVRAGLVSSPLVIITAFTAIATFSVANYRMSLALRILRIPLMILGASFGMYGIVIGLILIVTHLSVIEVYGIPYLAPFIPKSLAHLDDLVDVTVVTPSKSVQQRPAYLQPEDNSRQKP